MYTMLLIITQEKARTQKHTRQTQTGVTLTLTIESRAVKFRSYQYKKSSTASKAVSFCLLCVFEYKIHAGKLLSSLIRRK